MRSLPLFVLAFALTAPVQAEEIGLVSGSFAATYQPTQGVGCTSLLVTGQFVAPTPGYALSVAENAVQEGATILELVLTATPPGGVVAQVVTPTAVEYADPDFAACPYGVSISYEKQRVVMPLLPASIARGASQ